MQLDFLIIIHVRPAQTMPGSYTQEVRATKNASKVTNVLQGSEKATIVLSTISNTMGFLLSLTSTKKDFSLGQELTL